MSESVNENLLSYPTVTLMKDGRVYVSYYLNGARKRIFSGIKLGIPSACISASSFFNFSSALKIIEEARRQETQNHDMERFMVDAKALTRSEQNELLNELVSLSKVDHKITNEEATFIMIAAEALSFNINGVMSTLTQNGLDLNSYQSYVNTNFNTNSSSSNNTDNEVGFLAAKRRYEQENQQQTKFCPECGTAFSDGSFCGNCGTSL